MFVQGTKELISAHFINHGTVATNARKKKIIKICKKSTEIKNPEDRYNADPEKKRKKKQTEKESAECKRQAEKTKYYENAESKKQAGKTEYDENLKPKKQAEKKYSENPEPKKEAVKRKYTENLVGIKKPKRAVYLRNKELINHVLLICYFEIN